jgi:hypothetical protein
VWERLRALLLTELRAAGEIEWSRAVLVRYDRRADIHESWLALGCCLICFRRLQRG